MVFTLKLNKPFSADSPVDDYDVKQVKRALNYLGYYTPPENIGMTDIPDRDVFNALKSFQDDKGLTPSGEFKSGDATENALNAGLDETKEEIEVHYIWKTVGDKYVRKSHRALDGDERIVGEGLDPGEDPGCRCSAIVTKIVRKKKDNQLCINIWNSLQKVRDDIQDLLQQIAQTEG